MATLTTKIGLLSRFRGCLVGAVMGDCIGAAFEDIEPAVSWNELSNYIQKFENNSFTGQLHFTDDTAMARSIALSLAQNKGFNAHDLAKRFTEEYFNDPKSVRRGYGLHVRAVFETLKTSNYADVYKPASEQFDGSGSYGNGGGMRIAPAALFGYNMKFSEIKTLSEDITKLTHTHRHGILGAILQCYAVLLALRHDHEAELNPAAFLSDLASEMETLEKTEYAEEESTEPPRPKRKPKRSSEEVSEPYTHKLGLMKTFLSEDAKIDQLVATLGNDISALGSVPVAIYSFLRALKPITGIQEENPFRRAIQYAILMGGDTDTIATMTGAIAGAYHGIDAIPQIWQDKCEGVNDAIKQADDLYNFSIKLSRAS